MKFQILNVQVYYFPSTDKIVDGSINKLLLECFFVNNEEKG